MTQEGFTPKIVGFLCNWCSYAGADLAGVARFQYPPTIRVVRIMCSGRLDPVLMVETLLKGADGVLVGGCHIGDCHYIDGNHHAERNVSITKALIRRTGLEPERLRLVWVSAAEGQRFADVVTDFSETVSRLGPSPLRDGGEGDGIRGSMEAAKRALEGFRLRLLVSKEYSLSTKGNVYGRLLPEEELEGKVLSAMEDEHIRQGILERTREVPMSVKELAGEMGHPPRLLLEHIVRLRQRNLIALDSVDGKTPRYRSMVGGD
jgi:coenzyme F420-reducing hydrogenase delta subunit